MRSAWVPKLFILLFLIFLGGFAYLTQNPDSPYLEQAQEWPVVGEAARAFREAYLGPPVDPGAVAEPAEGEGGIEIVYLPARGDESGDRPPGEGTVEAPLRLSTPDQQRIEEMADELAARGARLVPEDPGDGERKLSPGAALADGERIPTMPEGSRSAPSLGMPSRAQEIAYIASEWRWFSPGHTIRSAPEAGAPVRAELASMAWLPVLDQQGSWKQVVFQGKRGWVDASWRPPYKTKWARRGLLRHRHEPVTSSDWGRYQQARKLLEVDKKNHKVQVGEYTLITDVEDPELIAAMDRAAVAAEEAYFARFGRLPSGNPGRSVVLFAEEDLYRQYLAGLSGKLKWNLGHAESGILAFFAEGRPRPELVRTLIHEIGHLLNDRALARRLPTWLEEGIATDLGSAWLEDSAVATGRESLAIQSPHRRLLYLGEMMDAGGLPPCQAVMYLNYDTFHRTPETERWAYAHSLALVRFLLDGDGGRHADGFREFLRDVAAGYSPGTENLLKHLELQPEHLDRGFRHWLQQEVAAIRQGAESRWAGRH